MSPAEVSRRRSRNPISAKSVPTGNSGARTDYRKICLATNYLILGLVPRSLEGAELIQWAQAGERGW